MIRNTLPVLLSALLVTSCAAWKIKKKEPLPPLEPAIEESAPQTNSYSDPVEPQPLVIEEVPASDAAPEQDGEPKIITCAVC